MVTSSAEQPVGVPVGEGKSLKLRGSPNPTTNGATPLAVISQLFSAPPTKQQQSSVNAYVLHGALQIFYLMLSVYLTAIAYYHRLRLQLVMMFYHHNRTPQLIRNDVQPLAKIPAHVAVVLNFHEQEEVEGGGVDGLLDQAGEVAAWCIGAGIRTLTVYERHGVLKTLDQQRVYNAIARKLDSYFGVKDRPKFSVRIPHNATSYANGSIKDAINLDINLISEEDGRATIVELAKTLAELAMADKISAKDLSVDIIDGEMKSLVMGEPDLLVLFTPNVDLQGFPPWQIRLSEIFHQPDNTDVSYGVFIKALKTYANCKINVGR
jgi:dehydrodolichyl diphosphate syntase complex subunit NUS1